MGRPSEIHRFRLAALAPFLPLQFPVTPFLPHKNDVSRSGYYGVMFGSEINPSAGLGGQFGRYLAQLLLVPPSTFVAAIPLFFAFSHLGIDGNLGHGVTFAGFSALICFHVGAWLGYVIALKMPSLIPTGCWIWVPPAVFVSSVIVPTLLRSGLPPRFLEYLYATGDNEGLPVGLITLPLSSLAGYSLGIAIAKVKSEHVRSEAGPYHLRALLIWIAIFGITTSLMVPTERMMVTSHKKLLVAVRMGGTIFALAPAEICRSVGAGSSRTVMLQSPTKLQFLDHGECPSETLDWVLARGIDRVLVLDGPKRGSEGWVITSQVWRPLPLP